ncbi:uncharacterized protein LOC118485040 [Helianthus annuus]|uniref:uncharacterized protein LOC118485040 n=1 Tax=Helianthus annuus TaxID=4232 RepID=UPI0016532E45|nr:uncharacterized protein LOC118485040 [Helianthus annuus]
MNWVAWDKTIAPVEFGGLGFGSLRDANLAMLAKWWWGFKTEKEGLWRKVIWAIHHNPRAWSDIPVKISVPGPWKSIISIRQAFLLADIDLNRAVKASVSNGNRISFWLDCWLEPDPLYIRFPELFKLEKEKECVVADRVGDGSFGSSFQLNWNWSCSQFNTVESDQLQQLISLLGCVNLRVGRDYWHWNYDPSGCFSVSGLKSLLGSANRERPNRVFEWNNRVPKKVAIMAWRSEMEKLPTKCALSARNIPVQDLRCLLCNEYDESSEHLFVSCHFAQIIWQNIASWCKIPPIIAFDVKDLLDLHGYSSVSKKRKKAIHAIVLVTFWGIWRMRNEVTFRQGSPNTVKVLEEIKAMAYLWVKNRSKEAQLSWDDWCRFKCFG